MHPTLILLLVTGFIWIVYDIYIVLKEGREGTISYFITTQSKSSLPLVFMAGFLMGHWFWPA